MPFDSHGHKHKAEVFASQGAAESVVIHGHKTDSAHPRNAELAKNYLQQEALDLMSSSKIASPERRSTPPLNLDDDGRYKVMGGNSLSSIAKRALLMRGESTGNWRAVNAEMDRIVEMNADIYPSLKRDRQFIREGWKLKVWDKELGPDATCKWQPWVEAPPNKWTIVNKCQRALGLDGSWLVVQPGGEAVLNRGAKAFLAPNGSIKMALPGSMITAIGGEIHDYGATIHQQNSNVRIFKEST